MQNSCKYFENKDCEYYPCHKDTTQLNCLFCYCPLYHIKNCPGDYKFIISQGKYIKSCEECTFPHKPENYEKIIQILLHQNQTKIEIS